MPELIALGAVRLYWVTDIEEAEQKDTAVSVLQSRLPALRTYCREENPLLDGSARNAPASFFRFIGGFHFAPLPLRRRPAKASLISCLSLGAGECLLNARPGEKRHHGWQHLSVYRQIVSAEESRLYNRICEGTIRPQKDGARTCITRAELERYVDACSVILAKERSDDTKLQRPPP